MDGNLCQSLGCVAGASLQCPNCIKLKIPGSFFCSQECFKSNWKAHKQLHKREKSRDANKLQKETSSDLISRRPMEDVLMNYCSEDIKLMYKTLNKEAKSKMLYALQSVLENQNQRDAMKNIQKGILHLGSKRKNSVNTEPILSKAVQSFGSQVMIEDYDELKYTLLKWGSIKPLFIAMMQHNQDIEIKINQKNIVFNHQTTFSTVTKDSSSNPDLSKLRKMCIRELKLFEIATGFYIEGTIITKPLVNIGLTTLIEDENGDYVQLGLYNMISSGPNKRQLAEQKFPVGLKIKIGNPFYKIFLDGNRGIRVDSPSEISISHKKGLETVDEIRRQAQKLVESGEHLEALDLYLEGLSKYKDTANILNNRAQAELKLGQHEEALLDAAATLMFSPNPKAQQRYELAAQNLGHIKGDGASIMAVWKKVLQKQGSINEVCENGTREQGNLEFKNGNFEKAKQQYTSALKNSEASALLNEIANVCFKLDMFQSSIAAASASQRLSAYHYYPENAQITMVKAFSWLGEFELSRLCCKGNKKMEKLVGEKKDVGLLVENMMGSCFKNSLGMKEALQQLNKKEVNYDFIRSDFLKHEHISRKKGRGIRATKEIQMHKIILVDHPVAYLQDNEDNKLTMCMSINSETRYAENTSHIYLVAKVLALIKHDGLLGKKLLALETRGMINDVGELPLVDLEWMAYRKLGFEALPFLPQTPEIVGCQIEKLTHGFINKILQINCFELKSAEEYQLEEGTGLFLRISLFNHDKDPNCVQFKVGDSMAILTRRCIKAGEELTIAYVPENKSLDKWGI